MKNQLNLFATISLALTFLLFTSCDQEETLTELQEIDSIESVEAKAQDLEASREFRFINGSGGRAIVSVKVVEGNSLEVQSRSSLRGGGNRLRFRHFITVNGQRISMGGSTLSITTDAGDKLHTRTYRNIRTTSGQSITDIASFSVDFIYSLIDRFNVSSRPIVVAVPPTRFTLRAAGE